MNTYACTFAAIALLMALPAMGNSNTHSAALPACAADGATVQTLAQEFKFTEGPTCDREGNVFFTDQPNNKIIRWDAENGKTSVFSDDSGRSNGLYFDKKGNLIACADMDNQLWQFDKKG